ncbi:45260_t:CDS:10 [Gigaspora margarita]|uniref:45260_t:CDS:1 n=1 Tax=Gigaspora margarita TaxID=4874 RepID=A0ABM8W473_GIGMA|nr:45260_t:CDS:10 [Gigaspora margarita]
MINVSSLNFNRGLIINAQGVQLSDFISYDFKPQHKNDFLSADELEHVCQIFDTDESINSVMADESSTNDIFLRIQCSKVELTIKQESIKPSIELTDKVKEALKHYDSYHKLMDVFNNYGYFLPKKMILGHKIYRITCLTIDQYLTEPNDKNNDTKWTTFDAFLENKLETILNQWEKYMKSDLDSLQVIGCKELYPFMQIDSTPGIDNQDKFINRNNIKERILMAGTVPIKDPPYSYSVKFPICFKSNNYKVFGKLITRRDEPIDEDPKIAWILIGIPDEVGYFSTSTRKINVLGSGNEPFALKSNNNDITLKVPENLPQDSVIVFSFNYPPSNSPSPYLKDKEKYSNSDLKTDNVELAYKNSFSNKKNVIGEGSNSNYGIIDSKSSYNKNSNDLANDEYNVYPKFGDNTFFCEYYEDSDSNHTKIDDFEHKKSNYDKRPSEKSLIKVSKYSIKWFTLRNSDIADLIYLNKIDQGFHLIKSKKPFYSISQSSISNLVNKEESKTSYNKSNILVFIDRQHQLVIASGAIAAATSFGYVFSIPAKPKHSLQLSERSPFKKFKLFFSKKNKHLSPTKNDLKSTTIHPLLVHLDNIDDNNSSTYYDDTSVYTTGCKISSTPNIPDILAQAFDSSSVVGSFNSRSIETLQEEEEDWDTNSDNFINLPKSMSLLPSILKSPISLTPPKFRYNRSNSLSQSAIPKSLYRVPSVNESWDDDFDLDDYELDVPNSVEQAQFSLRMDITNIRNFVSQIEDWEEAAVIIDLSDVAKERNPTFGEEKRISVDIEKIPSERHMQVLKKIIEEKLGKNAQDFIFMNDNDKDIINNEAVRKTSEKKKEQQETELKQKLVDDSRRNENFRISVEIMLSLIDHLKKLQNRLSEHIDKLDALASNE